MSRQEATAASPRALGKLMAVLEEDGLLIMALGVYAIAVILRLDRDMVADGWMDLVSGRWIAQHGLPSRDALTILAHGRRWIDQQWLGQLTFFGLWRIGGVKLALLVHWLLVTSGIAGAALIARSRGATARSVTWVAAPAFIGYYQVESPLRTQSFAFPLFVATLWLVLADTRQPSRRVFAAFPLLALWANLHGSVLLGALVVSLAGLVRIVERRSPDGHALGLLLAPWACVFASPYALHLPSYYRQILVGGDFKQLVTEWAPLTLTLTSAATYIIILGGLWILGRAGRRAGSLEQLIFALTAVLAFDAVRNMAWVSLTGLAVLPPLIDGLLRPTPGRRPLNRLLAFPVLTVLVVSVVSVALKPAKWFTHDYPSAGAASTSSAAGRDGRVFATTTFADWLLWARPELAGRLAFDARLELLSASQLREIAGVQARAGDWLGNVRGYRAFVLDRSSESALEQSLIERLPARVVFSSRQVVVLRRRG